MENTTFPSCSPMRNLIVRIASIRRTPSVSITLPMVCSLPATVTSVHVIATTAKVNGNSRKRSGNLLVNVDIGKGKRNQRTI